MAEINIENISLNTYRVIVHGNSTTVHIITTQSDYVKRLVADKTSIEKLLEKSFEFLLEREPNTSILRSFDLCDISKYFTEYEREIKKARSNLKCNIFRRKMLHGKLQTIKY